MFFRAALLVSLAVAVPVSAQLAQSQSYKFLQAVRGSKGKELIDMLDQPGQTIINTRDLDSGEGALHIVAKRGDVAYTQFLLARGADPNLRDDHGDTALLVAVQYGQNAIVESLTKARANPNLANASGETPLIRAVQKRDLALVRLLLGAGADPDQTDNLAGMSARDYAKADDRSPAIAKLFEETPAAKRRAVAGPKL